MGNLSGGEKTLSSLSLIFALHHYKPSPLYVMDEIDAALDFRNVSVIAEYIKERTKDSQFMIISLRNQMFELANELIGIYKTFDITKVVVFNPNSYDVKGNLITSGKKKESKTKIENKDIEDNQNENDENINKDNSIEGFNNSQIENDINTENKSEELNKKENLIVKDEKNHEIDIIKEEKYNLGKEDIEEIMEVAEPEIKKKKKRRKKIKLQNLLI